MRAYQLVTRMCILGVSILLLGASPVAAAPTASSGTVPIAPTSDPNPTYEAAGKSIPDAKAGKSVAYAVDLPAAAHLQMEKDGGVSIVLPDGTLTGKFDPAWAADSNGASVKSKFTVQGSTLTQTVSTTAATAYPVLLKPTYVRTGNAEDAKINAVFRGMMIPSTAPTKALRESTNASPDFSTSATAAALPFVGVPSRYVYNTSGSIQPVAWHDYCTTAPDSFYNANFRGPCANHDLCLMDSRGRSRQPCDDKLPVDMKVNCRYAYSSDGDMLSSCYSRASVYWAAVTANTKGWV